MARFSVGFAQSIDFWVGAVHTILNVSATSATWTTQNGLTVSVVGTALAPGNGNTITGTVSRIVIVDSRGGLLDVEFIGTPAQALLGGFNPVSFANGADVIIGTHAADVLVGAGGNDTILGGESNDFLNGQTGDDSLEGGGGDDTLSGELGYDKLIGGGGNDVMFGGDGNDFVNGQSGNDEMFGGNGEDTLSGEVGIDTLFGEAGKDTLFGGDGDDILIGGADADVLDGANGHDIASYVTASHGVVALLDAPAFNSGDAAGDTYVSIEGLAGSEFADTLAGDAGNNAIIGFAGDDLILGKSGKDLLFGGAGNDDIIGDGIVRQDDNAAAVRRLYIATLDRGPDDTGYPYWIEKLEGGTSLSTVVQGFIHSAEFQKAYGHLDNKGFVQLLYRNVLDRAPDAEGEKAWVGALNAGRSRADVVLGFSESAEFKNATDETEHAGQIYRLYESTFNRLPDAGGFSNALDLRFNGVSLLEIANGFINSAEFTKTYGDIKTLDNTHYVTLLYQNVLARAPDAAGLDFWVHQLASGAKSREQVLLDFSESQENVVALNGNLDAFMRWDAIGQSDTLVGGDGNDALTGGRGADTYRFDHAEGGWDTIYGFERFDVLEINGYGFTSAEQVLSRAYQSGKDVVIQIGEDAIIFDNTDLATIKALPADAWLFH